MGGAYAVDYGAVLAMASARGVDLDLVADLLPRVEGAMLKPYRRDDTDDPDFDEPVEEAGHGDA